MTSLTHFRKASAIARQLGIELQKSTRNTKKYMFMNPQTGRMVHFGAAGYEDFLDHGDITRARKYRQRHKEILTSSGKKAYLVKYSPAWASYNILW